MSTLLHWFTSPEWAQVVKALLHSLWQGALIALVLAIFLRRFGNPVTRYRASLAALTAIVFATVVTWAILNPASHHTAPPGQIPPPVIQPATPDFASTPEPNSPAKTVLLTPHRTTNIRWTAWLAFAWFAGAMLMLGRAGIKVAGAEKLRRSCQPLSDPRIKTLIAETRRALGMANRIRVGVTDKLTSPAVVGIVVPMLILPLALLTTLTPEQIRFVLLHELAHIRRRDYLANLFQFVAESLLFFNPAVWWISHQIRREREACCDALATELSGAPADYAQTLVQVAEQILYPAPAAASAFGNKREPSTLAERIQRLLVPGYRPSLRLTWRAMLAALILGGVLLFSSAVGTRLTFAAVLNNPQRTYQKLNELRFDRVSFSDLPLREVVTNLAEMVRRRDPEHEGIHFVLDESLADRASFKLGDVLIELDPGIEHVKLTELLDAIVKTADHPIRFIVEEDGVHFAFPALDASKLSSRTFKIDLNELLMERERLGRREDFRPETFLIQWLDENGVYLFPPKGFSLGEKQDTLTIEATKDDLDIIDRVLKKSNAVSKSIEDGKLLFELGKLDEAEAKFEEALHVSPNDERANYYFNLISESRAKAKAKTHNEGNTNPPAGNATPNLYARSNTVYTSPQRQRVYQKLNKITFDKIAFPNLPLDEVVSQLAEQTELRDPDKEGVAFLISKVKSSAAVSAIPGQPAFDPSTGQPLSSAAPADNIDLSSVRVALDPALKNVRLMDVLEAIVKTADHPIKYSLLDYGIEFSLKGSEQPELFTRTFKVDPNAFYSNLQNWWLTNSGSNSPHDSSTATNRGLKLVTGLDTTIEIQTAVINLFDAAGVKLTPPKSVFFNDRHGTLTVHATADDLDAIEECLDALNSQKSGTAPNGSGQTPTIGHSHTDQIYNSPQRQKTLDALNTISLDRVRYPGSSLSEIIRDLSHEVELRDPDHRDINFLLNRTRPIQPAVDPESGKATLPWTNDVDLGDVKINLDPGLKNVRLMDLLKAIVEMADHPIQYSVLDYGVEFYFHPFADPPVLQTRLFKIDPLRLLGRLGQQPPDDLNTENGAATQSLIFKAFTNAGFNLAPPRYIFFASKDGLLMIHATTNDLDAIEKLISESNGAAKSDTPSDSASSAKVIHEVQVEIAQLVQDGKLMFQLGKMDEAEAKLNEALDRDPDNQAALYYLNLVKQSRARQEMDARNLNNMGHNLPNPSAYARGNIVYTSLERQKVYEKLNSITFDRIAFPDLPLSEVVRELSEETRLRDPDKEGINFVFKFDKTAPPIDLQDVRISLDPGLKNVRLMDVLEAIVRTADHPIRYSLLDYGVEFSFKGSEQPELFTRTFRVDPNTFYMGLQNVGSIRFGTTSQGQGGGSGNVGNGNSSTSIPHVDVAGSGASGAANHGLRYVTSPATTADIQKAVINFFAAVGVSIAAPKSVFYNDRQGTLTVHATSDDLDVVEAAIDTLNIAPPEVSLKVRFVEVNQTDNKALGFQWYMGNFLLDGGRTAASASTQPSLTTNGPSAANAGGTFPDYALAGAKVAPSVTTTNDQPAILGILTDPQLQVVLNALEKREGADLLSEGQATTLSGGQAQFQMVYADTIADSTNSASISNSAGSISTEFESEHAPHETTLDVVPYVCADGSTIQMTLIPTVIEPVQKNQPGNFNTTNMAANVPITGTLPPPHSRVRQGTTTRCLVWDGQTVVFGMLSTSNAVDMQDKVPFLGDLPFVGRFFTSNSNQTQRNNLIIFVTPTIVRPATNSVKSDDYYDGPFLGGGFGGGRN